jgi:hypothetical protein
MPDSNDEFEQLREQHTPDAEAPGFDLTLQVLLGYIPFPGTGLAAFYNYLKIEQFESRFETFKEHELIIYNDMEFDLMSLKKGLLKRTSSWAA